MLKPGKSIKPGRRNILRALSTAALLPLLNACGAQQSRPLVVASHVWPGYELMFLARREGWLPAESLNLLETVSATASLAALADGKADGAALTLDEVLRARAEGIRLTIVLVFDISAGADVVLARPNIHTLADLAGKRIGVEKTALGELVLHKLLTAAGLPDEAVSVIPVSPEGHMETWQRGQLDALITYEPTASRLKAEDTRIIYDSRDMPDTIFDVLAVRPEAVSRHQEALKKLVAGHFRALQHFRSNPQDAAFRLAGRMHLEAREVLDAYRGLQLPDIRANRSLMDINKGHLLSAARELSQVMARAGLLARPDDLGNLVRTDFLLEED
ncbi:MAG: ABC transporter substrate-binding protein [Gammaproteobacteria bacterium]|nr:ABC transporter substrate-binding protein [Gammaproteobacteria bacterium]MBU1731615.1 ABC transporter substrate-binding protein [Gammaproteobacteria bacterium]MBU1893775.1 ABC transporter substrate-binding protein [Gammaproteobacteria bacterium]